MFDNCKKCGLKGVNFNHPHFPVGTCPFCGYKWGTKVN